MGSKGRLSLCATDDRFLHFNTTSFHWLLKFFMDIQGVHKIRVQFKKFITLFVCAIKIICKKN